MVSAFTVGAAALDGLFAKDASALSNQIDAIYDALNGATQPAYGQASPAPGTHSVR